MRIGILSDSHGHIEITARAVELLLDQGAEILLHLGDFETEAIIDELVGHPARIVFGNCDWDLKGLSSYARHVGVTVDHPLGIIEADEKRIAFTHGHLRDSMEKAIHEEVDYLLHGHTHELRDERFGPTRIINPGALFRARRYTVAILDPTQDVLEIHEITKPAPSRLE